MASALCRGHQQSTVNSKRKGKGYTAVPAYEGGLAEAKRSAKRKAPARACKEEDDFATNLVGLPAPSPPQHQCSLPQELTDEQFNVQFGELERERECVCVLVRTGHFRVL
eukprot:1160727-Pelagomonas_calceolata.AAC.32